MKQSLKFITLLLLILLSMLQLACTNKSVPVLSLGTNVWPGYEPLYLAREYGYFTEQQVRLVEYSSASQIIQSFRNGLIDAVALTLDEVLLLQESGEQLSIVLVMDVSDGADVIIGQKGLVKLEEMSGKRVGVESGALGAYMLSRALDLAQLEKQNIKIIPLDINEHEKAFLQGDIDAIVTFEPVRSKLLTAGGQQLFCSRQIYGEIVDVLVVRNDYLSRYPKTVRHLVSAWFKSLKIMKKHPRETAKILGQRMKLTIDETLAVYSGLKLPGKKENDTLLHGHPEPQLLISARKMTGLMFEQGLLRKEINPAELFTAKKYY